MRVDTLEDAIEAVNEVDYGLTSGLHTLDTDELATWLEGIEAGNLYVNRGITGAIVRRQPFGGWKRSAIGSTTKAGGPSYLLGLGEVEPDRDAMAGESSAPVEALDPSVLALCRAADPHLSADDAAELSRAVAADGAAWASDYGANRDVTGMACERNVLRYRSTPVLVRAGSGTRGRAHRAVRCRRASGYHPGATGGLGYRGDGRRRALVGFSPGDGGELRWPGHASACPRSAR